jgi:hypothetical protein
VRRLLFTALLLCALDARADITLPPAPGPAPRLVGCGVILDEARRVAATYDARFAEVRVEPRGREAWDLTLQRSGVYATVGVYPLTIDREQEWSDVGDSVHVFVRWFNHRDAVVTVAGLGQGADRRVREIFQRAADRCLERPL